MSDEAAARIQAKRGRRVFGCLVLGPLGCAAFALGGLASFVALLPTLVQGFVPELVESAFAERFEGRLEVDTVRLGWFSEQAVRGGRLLDPGGNEVASFEVFAPALLDLRGEGGPKLRELRVLARANLVADDRGVSNLERALRTRPHTSSGDSEVRFEENGDPWPRNLDVLARLDVSELRWSDAQTRASNTSFVLRDFRATLELLPGAPLVLQARGEVEGAAADSVRLDASLHFPPEGTQAAPELDLECALRDLPTALVDALAQQGGSLNALLGERLSVSVRAQRAKEQGGPLQLELETPRAKLALSANLSPESVRSEAGQGLRGELEWSPQLRAHFGLDPLLAAAGLERPGAQRIAFTVDELDLPWARLLPAAGAAPDIAELLEATRATLRLELGDWRLVAVEPAIDLPALQLEVQCVPGQDQAPAQLQLSLAGSLGPSARVAVRDLAGAWALAEGRSTGEVQVDVGLERCPTSWIGSRLGAAAALEAAWGADAGLQLGLQVARPERGAPLALQATGLVRPLRGDAAVPRLELELRASSGPSAFAFDALEGSLALGGFEQLARLVLAPRQQGVLELLGPTVVLGFDARPLLSAQRTIALELSSGPTHFVARGELAADGLSSGDEGRLELRLAELPRGANAALAALLPAGWELELGGPLQVRLEDFALPFALAEMPLDAQLREARARAELEVGLLRARPPGLSAPLEVRELALSGALGSPHAASPAASLEFEARLGGAQRNTRFQVRSEDVGALERLWLGGAQGSASLALSLDALPIASLEQFMGIEALAARLSEELALLAELRLARASAGDPLALSLALNGRAREDFALDLSARLAGAPFAPAEPAREQAELRLAARGLRPLLSGFLPAELAPYAAFVDGEPRFELDLSGWSGARLEGRFEADLAGLEIAFAGLREGQHVQLVEPGLRLSLESVPAAALELMRAKLPEGAALEVRGPLALSLARFETELPAPQPDQAEIAFDWQAALLRTQLDLALEVAGLRWTDAKLAAARQAIDLSALQLELDAAPDAPLNGRLQCSSGQGASLRCVLSSPVLPQGLDSLPPLELLLSGEGLPTSWVDAYAGGQGLLLDVLGETLAIELQGSRLEPLAVPMRGGLDGVLRSPLASARCAGSLGEGLLVSSVASSSNVEFALTPLASKRLVGGLLPLLVALEPVDPGQRASLRLSEFRLPLDGDLARLDAKLSLDLGAVRAQWIPGFEALLPLLGKADANAPREAQQLGPWSLEVVRGVVRYAGIPLRIAGKDLPLAGEFDLARREARFELQVPVSLLGKDANALLAKHGDLIDPQTTLPVEITGRWPDPKIALAEGFLEKLIEQALKQKLKKGLLDGLGGALGGNR